MKKNTTVMKRVREQAKARKKMIQASAQEKLTVGLDMSDQSSCYCVIAETGDVVSRGKVSMTGKALTGVFGEMTSCRIALEVGTHSPWVSRLLSSMGHEVIVANPHRIKLITQSNRKNDDVDAEQLARLARVDPKLLSPIHHRGEQAQADLAVIRSRAALMRARTMLINSARGLAKPMGERLNKCDADTVGTAMMKELSPELKVIIGPLLESVEAISEQLETMDKTIEEMAKRYPEVALLMKPVYGVGILIALTFVLTIEDPNRFAHSRDVGAYLGLQPKQRDSGNSQPQLGISKAGDGMLRSLLVQGAHCILRKGAPDSDLRAWGLSKMQSGGKRAKRRAIVAVGRKLGVLLHRLWSTGEVYDPLYNRKRQAAQKAA